MHAYQTIHYVSVAVIYSIIVRNDKNNIDGIRCAETMQKYKVSIDIQEL